MVLAIGSDVVDIEGLARALKDQPGLEEQLFSAREIAYCGVRANPVRHLGAILAAKEAFLKTMPISKTDGMFWREIEIDHRPGGPYIILKDRARTLAHKAGASKFFVASAHSAKLAIATVISYSQP